MSHNFDERVPSLHPQAKLERGSFVLYRSKAARIVEIGKKLELESASGKKSSVRPKDILLLSSSSQASLGEITQQLPYDELETSWQLLLELGSECSVLDLAEVVFSGSGPRELYNAFCLVNQTPYFKGRPAAVLVRSSEEVREEQLRKQRKQQEDEHWQRFYEHCKQSQYSSEDQPFIAEIEDIAFGEKQTCRLFREFKIEPTPENAHEWLLREQLWSEDFNPYLRRNQVADQTPRMELLCGEEEQLSWQQLLHDYRAALNPYPEQDPVPPLQKLEQILSRFCEQSSSGLWQKRKDLTHLTAWAIDDPWSTDPDDAISLEDSNTLWVHIADPASLLPLGSVFANEALQRGATVYTPEGTAAMLPKELVEILGLGLQPISMALSVHLRLQPTGPTVEVLDLCCSWVRVQRLSYDQADQLLGQLAGPLPQLQDLCQAHYQLRKRNHAVQFNMYNNKVVAGTPIIVESLPNTPSRVLVAEAMLMAGAAMALFAHQHQLPIAFLCQAPPKKELPPLDSMANMFLARKVISPSMVRSEAQPHASIGVPMYTRSTSPLRRYLDFLTHQQLHALLLAAGGHNVQPLNAQELLYYMSQAELQVSRVHKAQRCSVQHWQLLYLKQEGKHRVYQGVVLDVRASSAGCKALCGLLELGIEVVVFSKQPLQRNQELELKLKSTHLSLRDAHFQIGGK